MNLFKWRRTPADCTCAPCIAARSGMPGGGTGSSGQPGPRPTPKKRSLPRPPAPPSVRILREDVRHKVPPMSPCNSPNSAVDEPLVVVPLSLLKDVARMAETLDRIEKSLESRTQPTPDLDNP